MNILSLRFCSTNFIFQSSEQHYGSFKKELTSFCDFTHVYKFLHHFRPGQENILGSKGGLLGHDECEDNF